MALVTIILQGAVVYGVTWLLWTIFRDFFVRSPLDNIRGPASGSFVTGNLHQLFSRRGWKMHDLITSYGPVSKVHGLFGDKALFVYDTKALHHIVVKEQYTFEETPLFLKINHLMFGPGLLSSLGEYHRHQRKMLNPVFHVNHMRYMEPIFYKITHKLRNALVRQLEEGPKEVDVLGWMTRTALELVGQGGLGHSFDELEDDTPNPFAEALKTLVPVMAPMFVIVRLLPFVVNIGSASFRRRVVEMFPSKSIQAARELSDLMDKTSREILTSKRKALAEGNEAVHRQVGAGKDIMSVLLQANMTAREEDKLPDAELLGHMSTFLFAAMETTSGALVHILHMLAEHQDVQDKLRQEIRKAQTNGNDISYDHLVALPYLEAVCRETLRLHSPVTTLSRRTQKDVILPLSAPIRGADGTMMSEIPIPKDTDIMMGIMACNKDPAIWGEDANEWKPERWLSPLPDTVTEARVPGVYSNLMTFLGGGRACIGFKFSQLEMKMVLSVLISTFKFELSSKEIYWNFAGVQYPTVGTGSNKAEMFLRMSLLKSV